MERDSSANVPVVLEDPRSSEKMKQFFDKSRVISDEKLEVQIWLAKVSGLVNVQWQVLLHITHCKYKKRIVLDKKGGTLLATFSSDWEKGEVGSFKLLSHRQFYSFCCLFH